MAWKSQLYCTAYNKQQLPPSNCPEIAFVGRSNVGKSTLINSLLGRNVAKVSSKPGKTRSINFFTVEGNLHKFALVDLPGYGYAERGRAERDLWWSLIDSYFNQKRQFSFVVHLIDFRHGPLANDAELINWLDSMDMPRQIVFTKGDKIAHGKWKGQYDSIVRKGLDSVLPPFITTGANNADAENVRRGIEDIITEIAQYTRGSGTAGL